jgi:hypothetical protein
MEPSLLAQYAAASDAACPSCNYKLGGLTSDRCPECGSTLMLAIITPQLRSGRISSRFVLWWCFAFHLMILATATWDIWATYRILQQPLSGFPSFLWQVVTASPLTFAASAAIVLSSATWLAFQNRLLPDTAAQWSQRLCIGLLVLTLILPVIDELV